MNNIKNVKRHLQFITFLLVVCAVVLTTFEKDQKIEEYLNIQKTQSYVLYNTIHNQLKEKSQMVFNTLVQEKKVLNIMQKANEADNKELNILRDELFLLLNDKYQSLRAMNIKQFHFHLPNNYSFLRMHKPDKYGDDLSTVRKTVAYVNEHKRMITGFEVGKVFSGFRFIYPITNEQNIHLGSVEISFDVKAFTSEFKKNFAIDSDFFINKSIVDEKVYAENRSKLYELDGFVNFYKVIQKHDVPISYSLNEKVKNEILASINNGEFLSVLNDDKTKVMSFMPIQHPLTKEYVAFLALNNNTVYVKNKMLNYYVITSMVAFFILLVMYYIFRDFYNQEKYEKTLEDKVEEQSRQIRKNLEIISEYVIYSQTDLKGIITDTSSAFCKIAGYSREELIGQPHSMVRHEDTPDELFEDMWKTIEADEVWVGEVKNKRKNGEYYWVSANVSGVYNEQNEKIGYISIRHDITAIKDYEQEHILRSQAEKVASLGELVSNIAHQWRQPLSTILTYASGMHLKYEMNQLKKEDMDNFYDAISENTNYLSSTLDTFRDLVDMERVEKDVELQSEIKKALGIMESSFASVEIELRDKINYDESITAHTISGELPQVLMNILDNAKNIIEERKIEKPWIELAIESLDSEVIISVEDNAGGVEEDLIGKIFEPYFTTKHQSQGKGLGLHISYRIVRESLKGNIFVQNTKNGAKFVIKIPKDIRAVTA